MLLCSTGAESTYHQCCHRFVHSVVLFEFQDVQVELLQPEVGTLLQQLGDESHQVSFVEAVKAPLLQGRKPRAICGIGIGKTVTTTTYAICTSYACTLVMCVPSC